MVGIYKITSPKGKVYIGQSIDIKTRWGAYKYYNSASLGKKIKNSLTKYGVESHIFEVIEECKIEELTSRETYWIQHYNSFKKGLNSTQKGGKSGYSTELTRQKQSKGLKGREGAWKNKPRPNHSQWLIENGCGLSYERTEEHKQNLSNMMKEVWKDKGEEISKKITQNKIGKGTKPIICNTLYGIEFPSLKSASIALGLNVGNICEVLKGDKKHIKGFVFSYKVDFEL